MKFKSIKIWLVLSFMVTSTLHICGKLLYFMFSRGMPIVSSFAVVAYRRLKRSYRRHERLWKLTSTTYKIYFVGLFITFLWCVTILYVPHSPTVLWIIYVICFIYTAAFIAWATPIVQLLFVSWWSKWIFLVGNALILIFSTVYARTLVQEALQLPPQYFELTVSLVSLLTYVPVALGGSIFVVAALVFPGAFVWMLYELMPTIWNSITFTNIDRSTQAKRTRRRQRNRATKAMFYVMGSAAVLSLSAQIITYMDWGLSRIPQAIRIFAYKADFQLPGKYPGLPCDARIRLMDNGIVALAKIVDGDVDIVREIYPSQPKLEKTCSAN